MFKRDNFLGPLEESGNGLISAAIAGAGVESSTVCPVIVVVVVEEEEEEAVDEEGGREGGAGGKRDWSCEVVGRFLVSTTGTGSR